MDELVLRLEALIDRLNGRLSPQSYEFISDQPGHAEWELAIESLWEEVDRGAVVLSPTEHRELEALTNHPAVNKRVMSAGKRHLPPTGDIGRR
ncbi:MAG: hypothetical protein FIA92_15805 [Chloroflexi bacterium]|nr:hypothetical protein [Chloroflexota bacterium]